MQCAWSKDRLYILKIDQTFVFVNAILFEFFHSKEGSTSFTGKSRGKYENSRALCGQQVDS